MEKEWANQILERIYEKTKKVAKRNYDKIPYTTENGVFDDWSNKIGWWTNGFWAGLLWQLYNVYNDEEFKKTAIHIEEKLDKNLMEYMAMDHDSGFKWLLTAVADYKLTGSLTSKNRALLAAANLAGRFNVAGNYIRAWNDPDTGENAGLAIIDCMMNLPLLYWASKETKDSRFSQIARHHADMAKEVFIREDGSANHIVKFDQSTGAVIESLGGQGYGVGSSWTRGQAWALYGFTLSYIHTKEKSYLDTAVKVADYFISQIPNSKLIPVDFCQPNDCTWEDSTAAAIAACGLLELEKALGSIDIDKHSNDYTKLLTANKNKYRSAACELLKTLADLRCNWDSNVDHLVEKCTAAYHDEKHEFAIIYGDYFFTEAILKLNGKEIFLW